MRVGDYPLLWRYVPEVVVEVRLGIRGARGLLLLLFLTITRESGGETLLLGPFVVGVLQRIRDQM